MNDKDKKVPQIVLDAMKSAEEAQARVSESMKSLQPMLSAIEKIKLPDMSFLEEREIKLGPSIEAVREQNNWERHTEMLDVQNALLQTQEKILKNQRSGKKLVIIGLVLSGLAALFAAIAIVPVLPVLGAWIGQTYEVLKSLLFASR